MIRIVPLFLILVFLVGGRPLKAQELFMLVDVSGSMEPYLPELEKMLPPLAARYRAIKVFVFSDEVKEIPRSQLSNLSQFAGHNTRLTLALKRLRIQRPKGLILITDGKPNNTNQALKEAAILRQHTKICSIYVGKDPAGLTFLKRISFKVIRVIRSHDIQTSLKDCLREMEGMGLVLDPYEEQDIFGVPSREPSESADLIVE